MAVSSPGSFADWKGSIVIMQLKDRLVGCGESMADVKGPLKSLFGEISPFLYRLGESLELSKATC